jgi:hypothetical protein
MLESDQELDKLLESLEKGTPTPEAPAPKEEEVIEAQPLADPEIETVKDDPPVPPTLDLAEQLEKSEQRFRTLEGMMKADQRRSAEIISGLEERLEEQKVAQVEAPLDLKSVLTEEEMGQFGEEGIEVLRKLSGALVQRQVEKATLKVEQKLKEMQLRVQQAEATAEGTTIWDEVDAMNPGAKAINAKDTGWFAFLAQTDPISGRTYRELGSAATNVGDIQRLSQLIDTYRMSANLAKPVPPVKPAPKPRVPQHDGNQHPEKRKGLIFTQDEIREFFLAVALGKPVMVNGKRLSPAEVTKRESDIDAAIEDGRIQL